MSENLSIRDRLVRMSEDEDAIHAAFGFEPEWRHYVIGDFTNVPWFEFPDLVAYFTPADEELLTREIVKQGRCLFKGHARKWMRAQGFTACIYDTGCDGNVLFAVFADMLRVTDAALTAAFEEHWR